MKKKVDNSKNVKDIKSLNFLSVLKVLVSLRYRGMTLTYIDTVGFDGCWV